MAEPDRKANSIHYDRHKPDYRYQFEIVAEEMHARCPVAWTETYGGHWVAAGHPELFEIARSADCLSNDRDVHNERRGYQGITIPSLTEVIARRSGFIEMDPPEQREYRQALNPYLSPAAVARWRPFVEDLTRACIDERIETGSIDFIDDLANIVPAVLTLGMMGLPLADWPVYCEPAHAQVYTPPNSPNIPRLVQQITEMEARLAQAITEIRQQPRPGLIDALITARVQGKPPTDEDILGSLVLLIGGGFDTTTALTSHSLEWLSEHPDARTRLSEQRGELLDTATEEFLRFFTPAPGDGRTVSAACVLAGTEFHEGDRLWLSWAMANRDERVFRDADRIILDRSNNRHASFGLGIHRCIGSNVARQTFKVMLTQVLDRLPDYVCDPVGTEHYESIGTINGMLHLPATFTPGPRTGAGFDETLERLRRECIEQGLAEPVTSRRS
jgi:cytochrome P450